MREDPDLVKYAVRSRREEILNENQTLDRDKSGIQICNCGVGMTQGYQLDQSLSLRLI